MSKKKQKKTSLKSAILLLLLMALLLITSSYAWFTANQTVTISTLQVNVKASNGLQISADATYFSKVTTKWATTANNTATKEFAQLSAGVTKIRVYMWVEGQDVDCENGASGTDITFDLQFTATKP